MKVSYLFIIISTLAFSPHSHAEGWLDSIKSMLGMEVPVKAELEVEVEAGKSAIPNVADMISSVSNSVGIDKSQAEGSLASVFNYAKENISAEQFSGLSDSFPGLDSLMGAVPDISAMKSAGGLSGLMDKASNYSDSLKSINELKKQFEALGLSPEMITQVVSGAQAYLDTDEGKKIKSQLMQGLSNLSL
ncbi:MAG: hypothetical protein ACI9UT_003586 [Flavobacteriales bacterium]|jgi:hypothetical protein